MIDDILVNKAAIIERCIKRIQEEYSDQELAQNLTKQDSIILNLQRACEAAIDMGIHVVRKKHLGIPQSSRDTFVLLEEAKIISSELSKKLQAMVSFRNIALHDYTKLNLEILKNIVKHHLNDFIEFNQTLLKREL